MKPVALYDVLVGSSLFYVGITVSPKKRLMYHKARGTVPRDAVMHVRRWYPSKWRALIAERRRIARLRPPGNTVFHPDPKNRPPRDTAAERERAVASDFARANAAAEVFRNLCLAAMLDEASKMLARGKSVKMVAEHFGVRKQTIYSYFNAADIAALRDKRQR